MKQKLFFRIIGTLFVFLLAIANINLIMAELEPVTIEFSPADENPIILSPGEDGEWDAVSVRFPKVIFHEGMYHLFYGTFQDRVTPVAIGYAVSEDGIEWTKFDDNPIFEPDGTGFDAFGVTRPVVYVEDDGTWVMYYDGLSEQGQIFGNGIGYATADSPTGPWTRLDEPVLTSGLPSDWDNGFIFPDSIVKTDNGLMLYYSSARQIGMATSSDGIQWEKYNDPETAGLRENSDPVFSSMRSSWDAAIAWAGDVRAVEDGFEMFYYGNRSGNDQTSLGYAFSPDGIVWTRYENNPILDPVGSGNVFFPSVIVEADGSYRLYYAIIPAPGAFTEFGLAQGEITRNQ